jgi:hypothetical protein
MTRKIKALGLALVAALALTAVMASAAMATPGFTSDKSETTISGSQVGSHEFFPGEGFGSIECATAEFHGTSVGTFVTSQKVKPTYSGCEDNFGRTTHVTKNTAEYEFTVSGTDANGTPVGDIHMTGEVVLTVTTGGTHCTITIKGNQTFKNAAVYHNLGGTKGVTVTTKATGVHSTLHGGIFACGVSNGTTSKTGEYIGHTTITGKGSDGSAAAISVHGH